MNSFIIWSLFSKAFLATTNIIITTINIITIVIMPPMPPEPVEADAEDEDDEYEF